jgi:hypothetical protein
LNIVADLALLPIAFFLMKRGNPKFDESSDLGDVQAQVAMRRWLLMVLLKNAFGGSTDTKLSALRRKMKESGKFDVFPAKELGAELGIEMTLSDAEVENLLACKYRGKYTFLVLSLLYPDRDWKSSVFHEDHIFPESTFRVRELRSRGYDDDKISRYIGAANTVLNLELLTESENLGKNATPFDDWIRTRDDAFRARHSIPLMADYGLDHFEEFIAARRALLVKVLKAL